MNAPALQAGGTFVNRTPQGIVCMLIGMTLFAAQDAMMKDLLGSYSVWQLIATRSIVTLIILVPVILYLGGEHRLYSPFWRVHVIRAAFFAFGFSMFYAGFPYMSLASLVTIFFAAPLITATMAAVFLGETIGTHRRAALLVGLVGVVIAMKPGSDTFQWVSLLPLVCAISYAVNQMLVRHIGERDSTLTIGLYTICFAGVFVVPLGWMMNAVFGIGAVAPHLAFKWAITSPESVAILAILGVIGMVAYILLSRAYQIADVGAIAPFEYGYLPIAATLGYFAWGEIPTWHTLTGMVLIIAGGIYLGHRELKHARRARTPAPTAESPFVPGHPPPPINNGGQAMATSPSATGLSGPT